MSPAPSRVRVYTMNFCPYCERAKSLLKKRNIPFEEIKVADDDDAQWDQLFKLTGMKTMPQIFFDDKVIGGYSELAALDAQGGLIFS